MSSRKPTLYSWSYHSHGASGCLAIGMSPVWEHWLGRVSNPSHEHGGFYDPWIGANHMRSQCSGPLPRVVGNDVLGDDAVEASVYVIQGEGDLGGGSGHVRMSLAVYVIPPLTYDTRGFCCFTLLGCVVDRQSGRGFASCF